MEEVNHKWSNLLLKYLNGHLTEAELKEFNRQLASSPAKQEQVNEFTNSQWVFQQLAEMEKINPKEGWKEVKPLLKGKDHLFRPLKKKVSLPRIAAVLLACCLLGGGFYFYNIHSNNTVSIADRPLVSIATIPEGHDRATLQLSDGTSFNLQALPDSVLKRTGTLEIIKKEKTIIFKTLSSFPSAGDTSLNILTTPRGGQYQLVLPDNSQVVLNAASSISFPNAFSSTARAVRITGEAFFEVAKNEQVPFYVNVNDTLTVQVTGTSFNVHAYAEDERIQTTLLSGKLNVTEKSKNTRLLLKPGQQAVWNQQAGLELNTQADTAQAITWKNGYFDFELMNIKAILEEIARWYDLEIIFQKNFTDIKVYSSMAPRTASIEEIILMLNKYIRIRLAGRQLIVS